MAQKRTHTRLCTEGLQGVASQPSETALYGPQVGVKISAQVTTYVNK